MKPLAFRTSRIPAEVRSLSFSACAERAHSSITACIFIAIGFGAKYRVHNKFIVSCRTNIPSSHPFFPHSTSHSTTTTHFYYHTRFYAAFFHAFFHPFARTSAGVIRTGVRQSDESIAMRDHDFFSIFSRFFLANFCSRFFFSQNALSSQIVFRLAMN